MPSPETQNPNHHPEEITISPEVWDNVRVGLTSIDSEMITPDSFNDYLDDFHKMDGGQLTSLEKLAILEALQDSGAIGFEPDENGNLSINHDLLPQPPQERASPPMATERAIGRSAVSKVFGERTARVTSEYIHNSTWFGAKDIAKGAVFAARVPGKLKSVPAKRRIVKQEASEASVWQQDHDNWSANRQTKLRLGYSENDLAAIQQNQLGEGVRLSVDEFRYLNENIKERVDEAIANVDILPRGQVRRLLASKREEVARKYLGPAASSEDISHLVHQLEILAVTQR